MSGLSLVELLVSLFLGVLLSSAMVATYLSSKQGYLYDEQMARMQENGRYATRLLTRELSMAGFFGGALSMESTPAGIVAGDCADQPWALVAMPYLDFVDDFSGTAQPVSLNEISYKCMDAADISSGSDIVAIKRTATEASLRWGVPLSDLTASRGQQWYLRQRDSQLPQWERLRPLDLLDASKTIPGLSYWEAVAKIYFIRSHSYTRGDGVPSLCMETLAGNSMTSRCLVEGLENMQLEFGIDTDADGVANHYTAAPSPDELQQAVTAKIHLLLRSLSQMTGYVNNSVYSLGKTQVQASGDGYLRRVYSTAVPLGGWVQPLG
ncbi:MAG: type IV pilus assembly protein PilW [Halioglobus sp.]|jgi:type IV pilus assembly protein PilW